MIELFLLQSVASQNYYGANSFQLPNKTSVISQSDFIHLISLLRRLNCFLIYLNFALLIRLFCDFSDCFHCVLNHTTGKRPDSALIRVYMY